MDIKGSFLGGFTPVKEAMAGMPGPLEAAAGRESDPARREALAELARLLRRKVESMNGVVEGQVEALQLRIEAGTRAHEDLQARARMLARRVEAVRSALLAKAGGRSQS